MDWNSHGYLIPMFGDGFAFAFLPMFLVDPAAILLVWRWSIEGKWYLTPFWGFIAEIFAWPVFAGFGAELINGEVPDAWYTKLWVQWAVFLAGWAVAVFNHHRSTRAGRPVSIAARVSEHWHTPLFGVLVWLVFELVAVVIFGGVRHASDETYVAFLVAGGVGAILFGYDLYKGILPTTERAWETNPQT